MPKTMPPSKLLLLAAPGTALAGAAWHAAPTLRALWRGHGALCLALCLALLAPAAQARRVALLVGNAAYSVGALRHPPQDVSVMHDALLKIGFAPGDVVLLRDADQRSLRRAVQDFGRRAAGADVALLYYSGHGTQAQGQNWLIPVGADIRTEGDYELEAVSAQAVLTQLGVARPRVGIVVLDACRDNPAAVTKSGTKGLGRMDAGDAMLIAFATAPHATAADNGLYARVLAEQIQKPGLELLDVFRNTTGEVRRASGGRQVPRVSEVTLDQRVYLAGQAAAQAALPTVLQTTVSDADVLAVYNGVQAELASQVEYRARHILVDTAQEANALIAQIKAGASFEELAKRRSRDTGSGPNGGDLDFARADSYVPEFGQAMSKLRVGEMTATPVKSQFGWHVIRLVDKRAAAVPAFEQVKDQIRERLEAERRRR